MRTSWVAVEKPFSAAQPEHPSLRQTFTAQRSLWWGDEHRHGWFTASALLLVAFVSKLAGLSIAPVACLVFAVALIVADLRSRVSNHS